VIISNRKQENSDRRICEMMSLNEIRCNSATSDTSFFCFVSSWHRFEIYSYTKHDLVYRMNWGIYTPQAEKPAILLHREGKLIVAKLKSSHSLYDVVVCLPLGPITNNIFYK
jgi:hypothetical protein